jgi:phosphohistidine phosphatase SixA
MNRVRSKTASRCRDLAASFFGALLFASAFAAPVAAQEEGQQLTPRLQGMPLMEALREGGYTILIRHTATQNVTPDQNLFDIDDCSTQRNLSEEGERQAEQMGRSFEKLGIPVGEVLSSPYCRCMETGMLAFGKAVSSEVLRVGDSRPGTGRDDPGIAIRGLLDTPPQAGENTVLIAHSVTLLYAFGLTSRPEGIAHVFRPSGLGLGRPEYIGMVKPDEWPAYAGLDAENGAEAAPESDGDVAPDIEAESR